MPPARTWPQEAHDRLALGAFGLASAAVAYGTWRAADDADFGAFYCAGRAVDRGLDPYRLGFLSACEGKLHAVPSPLPGYDMAGFALFARLPFDLANALFLILTVAAFVGAIACLARLTRAPLVLIAAALYLTDGFINVLAGQVATFACLWLALAALLAERKRYLPASIAVLGTLVEPHLGMAVLAGALVAVPRMRRTLGAGLVALGGVSLAALGSAWNLEYFREALPRHAAAEIAHQGQLSLTAALHFAGVADRSALFFGALSYLAMLALGVYCGTSLARRTGSAAFALTVPAAFALAGGTFVHVNQLCLAVPAALLMYARLPAARPYAAAALALLAVPWSALRVIAPDTLVAAAAVGAVVWFTRRTLGRSLLCAALTASVLYAAIAYAGPADLRIAATFRPATGANGYVDDEWRQYVSVAFSDHLSLYFWLHVLSWAALGVLAYAALRSVRPVTLQPAYIARTGVSDS